jgi:hypothetical protein
MNMTQKKTVQEYMGVLVEEASPLNNFIRSRIILKGLDKEEYQIQEGQAYRFMEGRNLNRFLKKHVRIIGKQHQVEGKKFLEVLHIKPVFDIE